MSPEEIRNKVQDIIKTFHSPYHSNEDISKNASKDREMVNKIKGEVRKRLNYDGHISSFIKRDFSFEEVGIGLEHPIIPNATFDISVEFKVD